ncbi:Crp/Fnr family transcriptional regulator [Anaerobacillus isosaccharinicus]|uniref:Crp/Fnr family transcriptional regulator n=1 Tax=Anaerobacillus isosaccharinicus TaxID=1532552 RepID=A0A7S7L477_9BACI|nr:Crp/Fnr family transcriptional regulator [Anaerobacillus isosaccharinicus]
MQKTFFEDLSSDYQELLLTYGNKQVYKKGHLLFHEGEIATKVYLIISGEINLLNRTDNNYPLCFKVKGKNDLVGVLTIFSNGKYLSDAKVTVDTLLVEFHRDTFEYLLINNNELAVSFMKWLTKYSDLSLNQYRDAIVCIKKSAIYSSLIQLCQTGGLKKTNGIHLKKRNTIKALINYVGLLESEIMQALEQFEKMNVITINNRFIIVHDIKYFREQLNCDACSCTSCIK